ncbi:hypothetical protein AQY21_26200 [Paracoccus sp. MKU1]|nr:hypothetical protein AQY21_26200 [Paracoccus sp. MKU1]
MGSIGGFPESLPRTSSVVPDLDWRLLVSPSPSPKCQINGTMNTDTTQNQTSKGSPSFQQSPKA